jgi:hypothetical protein
MAGPEATPELQRYLEANPLTALSRRTAAGRAILSGRIEQIPDVLADEITASPSPRLAARRARQSACR